MKMPDPTIGEIVQNLFSNDPLLDMLEDRGWYLDINTVNEEEMSVLKSPDERLKIRQWDFPHLFMQYVIYDEEIVYHTRGIHGNGLFKHPEIYIPGSWEEKMRELHKTGCQ